MAEYLWHLHNDEHLHYDVIREHSASISMACFTATDGRVQPGLAPSVKDTLASLRRRKPVRKKGSGNYQDPALLYQDAWLYGPSAALTLGHKKEVTALLCAADAGCRPSDLAKLYRTFDGWKRQIEFTDFGVRIRFFWSKEVDPGSARSNATNYYFSKWVDIHSTEPKEISTPEVLRDFIDSSSDTSFARDHLPELDSDAQALFYGKKTNGLWTAASVDHISNLIKRGLSSAGMTDMTARSLRGASPSKLVQLFPDMLDEALALGRWTTPLTFHTHYQGKVDLISREKPPAALKLNPQQLLRWGFKPRPPPGISAAEYMLPPDHWVSTTVRGLGRIASFDEGIYTVSNRGKESSFYHFELMKEISKSRSAR